MTTATATNPETTDTTAPDTAPVTTAVTPVLDEDGTDFSLASFYQEAAEKAKPQPKAKASKSQPETVPPVGDTPPSEESKPAESSSSETTPADTSDASEKSETSEDKPMTKHEREKFKLREAKRKAEAEKAKLAKELAEIKSRYGEGEPEPTEPDPVATARFQERIALSKEQFIEKHGEAELVAQITGDDAPWKEIEEQAKAGDTRAISLQTRALHARNPFQEAREILKEEALFEQYGTRSISQVIAKALAEQEEAITAKVMAKLQPTRAETGKPPKTLATIAGTPPPSMANDDEQSAFSLRDFYGAKK